MTTKAEIMAVLKTVIMVIGENVNCYYLYKVLKNSFPQAECLHAIYGGHVLVKIDDFYVDDKGVYLPIDENIEERFIADGLITND